MFCCTLLYVHSSIAIILMGKRELIALLNLSSWCLVMVEWLFLAVPRGCLRFVIVVFPDHTHYFCATSWSLLMLFFSCSTNTWGQHHTSPIQINVKVWITVTGWMAKYNILYPLSFHTANYFQLWYGISWHHVMLKAKQAWCLLASWLLSIVLCFGNQSIC